MLKRIYIDNFRGYVNFEMKFDSMNLLLGPNDAGKSTLFEALWKLRDFIIGNDTTGPIGYFQPSTVTAWYESNVQQFEVEIKDGKTHFRYRVNLEHSQLGGRDTIVVKQENLYIDGELTIDFDGVQASTYAAGKLQKQYPLRTHSSVISTIPISTSNVLSRNVGTFVSAMKKLTVVRISPMAMEAVSSQEEESIKLDGGNFTSFYRHISQDQGLIFDIANSIHEAIPGFSHFSFTTVGTDNRALQAIISNGNSTKNSVAYRFDQLSDGQRALIVLYALLLYARKHGATLCIDEPANFIALREIQPWLVELREACEAGEMQALLISHHPELINYLASDGYWFDREPNSPVRVRRLTEMIPQDEGVPISELVARGWLGE